MFNLPLTFILSEGTTSLEVNSARPNAPVVPDQSRGPRVSRSRLALAGALERAAAHVAPADYAPAR